MTEKDSILCCASNVYKCEVSPLSGEVAEIEHLQMDEGLTWLAWRARVFRRFIPCSRSGAAGGYLFKELSMRATRTTGDENEGCR
jgi:hypothetical protein